MKIFKHSLLIVSVFIVVTILMISSFFFSNGMTSRIVHKNYEGIQAALKMNHAWMALRSPDLFPGKTSAQWKDDFQNALSIESTKTSDPSVQAHVEKIKQFWNYYLSHPQLTPTDPVFSSLAQSIQALISDNESKMFSSMQDSDRMSRTIFLISVICFVLATGLAVYFADELSVKIAGPLKEFAEVLRKKPLPGMKLSLPKPTSLEMRILTHEMSRLWDRLSELHEGNWQEISNQGRKLSALFAAAGDVILVLDNQERVLHCNSGLTEIVGLREENILGQAWKDLPSYRNNYFVLRRFLNPHSEKDLIELEGKNEKGSKKIFAVRHSPLLDEFKNQIGSLYLLNDVTWSKQKDRLKEYLFKLQYVELDRPLQALDALSKQVESHLAPGLDKELVLEFKQIQEQIKFARAASFELNQFASLDFHSKDIHFESTPIENTLKKWLDPLQTLASQRGIQIHFQREGSELIKGRIDQARFSWAFSTLVNDAIRISSDRSPVDIHLTDRESRVDITIHDEGAEIPEEDQSRLFEVDTRNPRGLLLGLVREIVHAHEGRLEYFPRKPKGSTFRISLPLI